MAQGSAQIGNVQAGDLTKVDWHARQGAEVIGLLGTSDQGLSPEVAAARLAEYGPNALPPPARTPAILRFLAQFNNVLIYFLVAAAAGAALLGHRIDAAVIVAVVLANAIVGFVQEGKAEQALAAIRELISPQAAVLRGGHRISVPGADLVPGDVVLIEAGDRVPADLRLIHARNLVIDEAILTGESVASEKHDGAVAADAPIGDRSGMAFSGTMVATGTGTGIVTATGVRAEIGRISALLGGVDEVSTPLLAKINDFGRRFTLIAIFGALMLFAFSVFVRGQAWDEALLMVVALAVGVVPEGLPAVITITLAIGVRRMAARNAIIRKLPAVETLGATAVICSDKTGTLTMNEMMVASVATPDGDWLVEGAGYSPVGAFLRGGAEVVPDAAAKALIRAGLLANDGQLAQEGGLWRVEGDPMDGALVAVAEKAGLGAIATRASLPRLDQIPFDAAYRYMAVLNDTPQGRLIHVKGAPEPLLAMSTASAAEQAEWADRIARLAGAGQRVLGFAAKTHGGDAVDFADMTGGFTFLGIAGFIDPPRPEATAAVAECRGAGIGVRMITGDHALTAGAIAAQLGIADNPRVMTGAEVEAISDADLPEVAARTDVFARTSPEHKLRIVRALQSRGQVVAMTGDGVNDAPALKQADVGIAMGRKGTEAARQAAEMVLTDDNFATIVNAVEEGRTVFDNIRKVISWTVPTNGGEVIVVIAAILLGLTAPMAPAQILWINLVLSATLGLALAFEPPEPGVMARAPRPAQAPLLSPFMVWRVIFVSLLFTAGVFAVWAWGSARDYPVERLRTLVVNTLVVMEIFYLFNVRYMHMESLTLRGIRGTRAVLIALAVVVVAQLAFTYLPVMHALFNSAPLSVVDGLAVLLAGIVVFAICEAEKTWLIRSGRMARMGD